MSDPSVPTTEGASSEAPKQGFVALLTRYVLIAMPLVGMVYALRLFSYAGYALWREQAALALLGLGLAAAFLTRNPAGKPHGGRGPGPLDLLFAFLGFAISIGAAVRYEELIAIGYLGSGAQYYLNLCMAGVVVLLLIEAVRRLAGWPMVLLVACFLFYALFADQIPGALRGQSMDLDFLTGYLFLDPSGILGIALSVVLSTVIAYVLLGAALFRLGGGPLFLDISLSTMGRYRGGSAKAAVVASSLFGTVSGSAVANVMTTGIVTIPLMKASGFKPARAGAVEAVASTGGQLLPPVMGAAAFVMAEFLGLPYADVALFALLPAMLFYFAVFMQIHLYAARAGLRPLDASERPRLLQTLRRYWMFLVPIGLLIYLLFVAKWQPALAALACTAATFAAGGLFDRRNLRPAVVIEILVETGRSLIDIVGITAIAGVIIGVLSITGLSFSLGIAIVELSGSNVFILLLAAAVTAIIFGMGMPTTAVYIIVATLIAPALVQGGIEPVAAHLFLLYYGALSMITPPVCLASFAAASLSGAPFMRTGLESVKLGAVALMVPFVFVTSPALLLQGQDWIETARALATGIAGCVMMAAAIEGYLKVSLSAPLRLLAAAAGIALLLPDGPSVDAPWAGFSDITGLVLALPVVVLIFLRRATLSGGMAPGAEKLPAE